MIKNIIFDLGNVLLNFKPETFLLRFTKDEQYIQHFISKVVRNRIWFKLDRGTISIENAKEEFIKKYPEDKNLLIMFFEHWIDILTPIQENIEILHELKSHGYYTYILSNFIEEAFDIMEKKYKFFSLFDGKIISCQEKVIKPEIEIYQKLLAKYKLVPDECVFIDDIPSFLSRAKKLNMKTILYTPKTDLRMELRKLKITI